MRLSLFFSLSLLSGICAQAESPNCEVHSLAFSFDSNSPVECQTQTLEGLYQIKICKGAPGLLYGQDGSERLLFYDYGENSWRSTQRFDLVNSVVTKEILRIDDQLLKFSMEKVKSKDNGTVLEQIECKGLVRVTP